MILPIAFIAVSLLLALLEVNQLALDCLSWLSPGLKIHTHLFTDTIAVNGVHKNVCHVGAQVVTFEWCKCQLLGLEFPILRPVFRGEDIMASDQNKWIAHFRCPCIKGNLSMHVLKTWVSIADYTNKLAYLESVLHSLFYHLCMANNLISNLDTVGDIIIIQRWAAVSNKTAEWGLINQLESHTSQYLLSYRLYC